MLSFKQFLSEAPKSKGVVVAFGRMNPPTIGHKKLMEKIVSVAKQEGAEAKLYLSHSVDSKKNPLDYKEKLDFVRKIGVKDLEVVESPLHTIYQVVESLGHEGYERVWVVCGSDRIAAFQSMKKYAERWNIKTIEIVSSGERDEGNDDISGASATKMRNAAANNDRKTFDKIAGVQPKYKDELWKAVRKGMNLD